MTNYFASIISYDLYGLEEIVVPSLFKYTQLEPDVMPRLWNFSTQTNRFDSVAPIVAWNLLDCLSSMLESGRPAAKQRVARFMYRTMRQVTASQTWQDEQLAKLIPAYSNSLQRLEGLRYLKDHSVRTYEREKATQEFIRLNAIPTNMLNDVQWISE